MPNRAERRSANKGKKKTGRVECMTTEMLGFKVHHTFVSDNASTEYLDFEKNNKILMTMNYGDSSYLERTAKKFKDFDTSSLVCYGPSTYESAVAASKHIIEEMGKYYMSIADETRIAARDFCNLIPEAAPVCLVCLKNGHFFLDRPFMRNDKYYGVYPIYLIHDMVYDYVAGKYGVPIKDWFDRAYSENPKCRLDPTMTFGRTFTPEADAICAKLRKFD